MFTDRRGRVKNDFMPMLRITARPRELLIAKQVAFFVNGAKGELHYGDILVAYILAKPSINTWLRP